NLNSTGISTAGALTFTGTSDTLSNAITMQSDSSIGGVGSGTLSGVVSGSFNLTKVGAGTLTLSNGSNSYTGSTTINVGTLKLGSATAIPSSSTLSIASGATFDINGFSYTMAALSGAGNTAMGAG